MKVGDVLSWERTFAVDEVRRLTFRLQRPVYTGNTVRCEVTIEGLNEAGPYTQLKSSRVCRNRHGKEVMPGEAEGVIRI